MVDIINPSSERFLANVNQIQQRLNQVNEQLTSGLKIQQVSDNPGALTDLFQTRTDLARVNQVSSNLNLVTAEVNTADSTVQGAIQLLDQVRSLGAEGANTTTTPAQYTALAQQVQQIFQQLVGLTHTQVNGVYIFSGDQTSSAPYQVDLSAPNGVDQLVKSQATRLIQDPTGLTFAVAQTAQQLFDARDVNGNPTSQNVFSAVFNLYTALQNNDQAGVATAVGQVQTAQGYLNQQTSFYGAVQNRISAATDLASKFQTQLQAQLSSEQDADIPAAAVALQQDTNQLDAALASQAKQPNTSLFDYLR